MQRDWITTLRGRFDPTLAMPTVPKDRRPSAVLVPLGWNANSNTPELILTKRHQKLPNHAGEICFPGGFWESSDKSLLETATREAAEEISLKTEAVKYIGALPPVATKNAVVIFPFLAEVPLPYSFSLNTAEVEKVIHLPVPTLLERGIETVTVHIGGLQIVCPGLHFEGELIWGATAKILLQLISEFSSLE